MTTSRQILAWILTATALLVAGLVGSYLYLERQIPTDPVYLEHHLTEFFKVDGAKKAGYSNEEIVAYVVKAKRSEFDLEWRRIYIVAGAIYGVMVLGLVASYLYSSKR